MLYDLVSPFDYTRENFISFLTFTIVNDTLMTPLPYIHYIQGQAGLNLFGVCADVSAASSL